MGNKLTIAPSGRLSTTTAPTPETELKQNISAAAELALDLAALESLSPAGLRVLLSAQKVISRQGQHGWSETQTKSLWRFLKSQGS